MALPTTTASALAATVLAWSGVEMPNPTAMGKAGVRANPGRHVANAFGNFLLHPGDAFPRHVINKTRAAFDDQLDAIVRGGWRDEVNHAKSGFGHERLVIFRFFRRQVERQEAVHAGAGGIVDELFQAVPVHQVEINVEDDGDLRLLADGGDGFQHFGRGRAGFQPALGGQLIDQAVRQRIAERNAQLQDINADAIEGQRQLAGGFEVGVAGADIDNEAFVRLFVSIGRNVRQCDSSRAHAGRLLVAMAALDVELRQ